MSLKTLSDKVLKYSQIRSNVLKSLGILAEKFAKLRAPVLLKVGPQIAAADKLRDEILAMLPKLELAHFIDPKSQVLHGVKVGFRKSKESLYVADEGISIDLIERIYGTDSPLLKRTVSLDLNALSQLGDDVLAILGIKRDGGENEPICSVSDGLDAVAKKLGVGAVEK